MPPEPLTEVEEQTWRAIARLMVVLPRAVDEDLARRTGLRMTSYVVLMALSETPERQLPMAALAERVAISASRMTRVVDGLERSGDVVRVSPAGNRRISMARLTDAGLGRLVRAWPEHLAGVRRLVVDQLAADELSCVTRIAQRLLGTLEQEAPPIDGDA